VGSSVVLDTGIVVSVAGGEASTPWQAAATTTMAISHPKVGARRVTDMNRTSVEPEPA
jgi:hypothetical protein